MELEQQVCSLELAKRLKELGVPQESLYYWGNFDGVLHISLADVLATKSVRNCGSYNTSKTYSAFTVAELGVMLPAQIEAEDEQTGRVAWYLEMYKHPKYHPNKETPFYIAYWNHCVSPSRVHNFSAAFSRRTEADARAKMLIYLLENKLMGVPQKSAEEKEVKI